MRWGSLVKIVGKDSSNRDKACCPVCNNPSFILSEGVGLCASCGFRGSLETVYRMLTGVSRECAQEEVKGPFRPKGQSRLL